MRVFAGRTPENAPRRGTAMTPDIEKFAGGSHDHGCSHPLREANPPFSYFKTMVLEHFLSGGVPETEKSAGERHDPHPLREANLPFSYFKTMVLEHFFLEGPPPPPPGARQSVF